MTYLLAIAMAIVSLQAYAMPVCPAAINCSQGVSVSCPKRCVVNRLPVALKTLPGVPFVGTKKSVTLPKCPKPYRLAKRIKTGLGVTFIRHPRRYSKIPFPYDGGYATNLGGVDGYHQYMSAGYHCKELRVRTHKKKTCSRKGVYGWINYGGNLAFRRDIQILIASCQGECKKLNCRGQFVHQDQLVTFGCRAPSGYYSSPRKSTTSLICALTLKGA